MKKLFTSIVPVSALLLLFSCAEKIATTTDADLADKIITLVTTIRDGESIELPELYDEIATDIPQDNDQNLILADKLELRGFKKTASGRRDQQLSGRRMFVVEMQKDDCRCEVSKVYYTTANISQYFVAERIKCETKN